MTGLPIRPACRVVLDNDWAGDPDGLVALAHHLLSPSNDVRVVTSSPLNAVFGSPEGTAARGKALAAAVIDLTGMPVGTVLSGPDQPFEGRSRDNAAADAIVAEARREDDLPLYLVCGGPLTNIADALAAWPGLADRAVLVWVGGTFAPGAWEYNRATDEKAAAFVLETGIPMIEFPLESYAAARVPVAALEHGLVAAGSIGEWLWQRFVELPLPAEVSLGEVWALGDSLPLLVTALGRSAFEELSAVPGRRAVSDGDVRLIVDDLFAKLRLAALRRTALTGLS